MSTISLYIDIDVSEINDALGEEGARELAEYYDLPIIDPNDDADATALDWAERHDFIRRPSRAELRRRLESAPLLDLLTDLNQALLAWAYPDLSDGDRDPSR